jgi:hypothetical protein
MADEARVTRSSLRSFDDAATIAFGMVPGDPQREGAKAAEVSRLWMTGGGFVGVPQYHVELRVLSRTTQEPAQVAWTCEGWYAYHDFMPGSPPTLHVGATCAAQTSGYHFSLVREEPQGVNPSVLLLRLVVEASEFANEVVTTYELHYREDTETSYDSVSIVPSGPTGIAIQVVQ